MVLRACAVLVVALGMAAGSDAKPRGLRIVGTVATIASEPFSAGPSAVRTDAAGEIFVLGRRRIAVYTAQGTLAHAWSIPAVQNDFPLLFDVLPDGTVLAAEPFGDTVSRFDAAGNLLGSWHALDQISALAADPRGSVLVSDSVSVLRFSPDGRSLGPVRGPAGRTTIAASGSRWVVDTTTVVGLTRPGRQFQQLSLDCPIGHVPPGLYCASGIGGFGAAPPGDLAAAADGGLAVADLGAARLQFFDRSGRVLFACQNLAGAAPVTAVTFDRASDDVLFAAGWSLYRARFTSTRRRGCRTSPLRVTQVRAVKRRRGWLISYRLSRPARVQIAVLGLGILPRSVKGPGRRGRNHRLVEMPAARGHVQIRALDDHGNSTNTPFKLLAAP
jgi:hypothetical protein